MVSDLSAFVLAGGKSTRMGRDKATLPFSGQTLLESALALARSVTEDVFVFILGSPELYGAYGQVIADIFPGCGPLGGIHAALTHAKTDLNLVLAVDTPFLSTRLPAYLVERARESPAMVIAPEIDSYPQPLCAVYRRDFLPIAEQALRAGRYKIVPLFPHGKTLIIPEAELRRFAFTAEMFENLNTPEELEHARRRVSDKRS
jgi:molybdopterin-guanine dinucleotide biosynthesis protein A